MVKGMYKKCKWLPELLKFDTEIDDEIIEILYDIFKTNFYDCSFSYEGKKVRFRKEPIWQDKEESFFHMISNKNLPNKPYYTVNMDRAKRLLWSKALILHTPCKMQSTEKCCNGVYSWHFLHNGKKDRVKILHSEYRYIVILENRSNYWLFITGYYIDNGYKHKDLIKEYKRSLSAYKF